MHSLTTNKCFHMRKTGLTRQMKTENMTKAERIYYGKPLLPRPGCRPLSTFHPDHPARTHGRDSAEWLRRDRARFV